MNDKQQEQNFPSSSIIKDVDNKFHQLLKETVHDFLFQPLEKKTCTNPIISNLLMHEVKVSTSQQQPRTSGFFDSRKRNIVEKTNDRQCYNAIINRFIVCIFIPSLWC